MVYCIKKLVLWNRRQSISIELVVPYDSNTSKWFQKPGAQNSNILISYSREINFGAALLDRIQLYICRHEKHSWLLEVQYHYESYTTNLTMVGICQKFSDVIAKRDYYMMKIKQKKEANMKGSKKEEIQTCCWTWLGQICEWTERCPLQLTIDANKIIGQTLPQPTFFLPGPEPPHEYQLTSRSAGEHTKAD